MAANADADSVIPFEEALDRARDGLATIESDAVRARRERALEHFASYLELLREATEAAASHQQRILPEPATYWLKLELEDGRWTVTCVALPAPPGIGDIVEVDAASRWQVRRVQTVKPAPRQAPDRDYFVCAPAA
jgi:hypothetical protein